MTANKSKAGWNFDNSYTHLPQSFFTQINPTLVRSPSLVILNEPLAMSLGLNVQVLNSEEGTAIFAGNCLAEGSMPIAQAYAGHQFGHFTMLGDGRAHLLGEQITPYGDRFDIQLKGSGRTPYSRGGDGRAALGPMLREYIVSEAMYGLGIPTTRSLAVVTTGESVFREKSLPGAVLTRVAASHIRVGTFQYVAVKGSLDELKTLADYTLKRHFSKVIDDENPYLSLLREVAKHQAKLIAKWQLVGFIHGVMNTDNMVLSGETIDYGPCAFMDIYDPQTVFSSIDRQGRYAYANQPIIASWNLARLGETLLPLIDNDEEKAISLAQEVISHFPELYHHYWLKGMRAKLGLFNEEAQDEALITMLLEMMEKHHSDYTNTFRALTLARTEDTNFFGTEEFQSWFKLWETRRMRQQESIAASLQLMKDSNPAIIPRNHRVEEALEAAVEDSDYQVMERLLNVLKNPYDYSLEQDEYSTPPGPSACSYQTFCGT